MDKDRLKVVHSNSEGYRPEGKLDTDNPPNHGGSGVAKDKQITITIDLSGEEEGEKQAEKVADIIEKRIMKYLRKHGIHNV